MLGAAEIMELNGPNWLDQFLVKPTHKSYVFGLVLVNPLDGPNRTSSGSDFDGIKI